MAKAEEAKRREAATAASEAAKAVEASVSWDKRAAEEAAALVVNSRCPTQPHKDVHCSYYRYRCRCRYSYCNSVS